MEDIINSYALGTQYNGKIPDWFTSDYCKMMYLEGMKDVKNNITLTTKEIVEKFERLK